MPAMSLNIALAHKENQASQSVKIKAIDRYARYISYQWYFKWFKEVYNASLCKKKLHTDLLPLQYSNFCLSSEWAILYSDHFYF